MKKLILAAALLMAVSGAPLAFAGFSVDGYVDDWNVDLFGIGGDLQGYLDSNLPSGGNDIDVWTEDNADITLNVDRGDNPDTPDYDEREWWYTGPGFSYFNTTDIEAGYFDNDSEYIYLAIVSGMSPTRGDIGDVFFNTDDDDDYEYALKVSEGKMYSVNSTLGITAPWVSHQVANPWRLDDGVEQDNSLVEFIYLNENQNTHYVLEAKIPLVLLGITLTPGNLPLDPIYVHWTMACGNDMMDLPGDLQVVPEPATMVLLGSGLLGLAGIGFRKKKS